MNLLVDVIIDMAWIFFMGGICIVIYIFGKFFLTKMGLIDKNEVEKS
tara:strand:- start:1619 stop:1759 length:141 start_codon:yes stop_codon:yes gene_type:complete